MWSRLFDRTHVAFADPHVGRVFIACDGCRRVKPHYEAYPPAGEKGSFGCPKCHQKFFRPIHLPEWRAALWVLGVGWFWRKTVLKKERWDPRVPIRE